VLEKSKVVGIGNHNELIATCERYQQLYNLQFNVDEREDMDLK
jgi:ABC-type multidrug transport system fused ATPase/permease subunit